MKRRKGKKQRKAAAPMSGTPPANPPLPTEQVKATESVVFETTIEEMEFSVTGEQELEPSGSGEDATRDSAASAASSAPAPAAADRRAHPRYALAAGVEVVAAASGERIKARLRDLSRQGCYVDAENPFALETAVKARIAKGARSFEVQARVVYTQKGSGMGLMFTVVEPDQSTTLDAWISEFRETSWLAANRRRSQRVLMRLPIVVSGVDGIGIPFEEKTNTLAISAHGALLALSAPVHRGLRLNLSNVQTRAALECAVIHIDKPTGEQPHIGVEFMLANPTFWHVAFPPKDWTPRHPDARTRTKANRGS